MKQQQSFIDVVEEFLPHAAIEAETHWKHVLDRIQEFGGTGEVTLTIKASMKGQAGVVLTPTVGFKAPKAKLTSTERFLTKHGEITSEDPKEQAGQLNILKHPKREA